MGKRAMMWEKIWMSRRRNGDPTDAQEKFVRIYIEVASVCAYWNETDYDFTFHVSSDTSWPERHT